MSRYTKSQALTDAIGARIKAERIEAGMSQRELASRVYGGLGSGQVSRYESGVHGPSIETLCLLASALGIDPGELLPSANRIQALLGVEVDHPPAAVI